MSTLKKRRLEPAEVSPSILSDIAAEVEIDIALKNQISKTLESRIAWALTLQETIEKGNGSASQDTLRTVALDALSVIEHSSDYILRGEPVPPPSTHTSRLPRPTVTKTQSLNSKPKSSFLYIRSNALVNVDGNPENHLYLLQCPSCSRTAFTSLQGLLNHARLTHGLEWGTHDECIRACAVVNNDLDVDAGVEVGVGPGGVLPALRTIFQNAVGQTSGPMNSTVMVAADKPVSLPANHLVQTLGLHGESPALAPYLGKDAVRRRIKVWDESVELDLEAVGDQSRRREWKMPFAHRNFNDTPANRTDKDYRTDETNLRDHNSEIPEKMVKPSFHVKDDVLSSHSRFHFTTRVIIADRSLWIPPDKRPVEHKSCTHKWMISVDSPSYTHHITSVLRGLRVSPSDSSQDIPIPPPTPGPPFVVVGYSPKPFLATVELLFSGAGPELPEQKVVFEHWVDLDPYYTQEPCFGQEQVVDVELDKNTILMPRTDGYVPVGSRSLWDLSHEEKGPPTSGGSSSGPGYREDDWHLPKASLSILRDAVKQFPMTLAGGRDRSSNVPYKLVSSPSQFRELPVGRQKAIEWARARAIQDAYSRRTQKLEDLSLTALSVADVYSWLGENGHFIREMRGPLKHESSDGTEGNQRSFPMAEMDHGWCGVCGTEHKIHSGMAITKLEDNDAMDSETVQRDPSSGAQTFLKDKGCHVVPKAMQVRRLPRLDVTSMCRKADDEGSAGFASQPTLSTANPSLTMAICRVVEDLHLPTFQLSTPAPQVSGEVLYPIDHYGRHGREVKQNIAVFQALALSTEQFLRALVQKGMEMADRDSAIVSGNLTTGTPQSVSKETWKRSKNVRILTPTHILSGVLADSRGRSNMRPGVDEALVVSLSRLGAGIDSVATVRSTDHQGDSLTAVKIEEET